MNEEIYKRMALKYLYPESQCHVEVCVASYMDDSISRVNEATSTLTKATEALLQAAVREKKKWRAKVDSSICRATRGRIQATNDKMKE